MMLTPMAPCTHRAFMLFLLQTFRFALNDGLLHITCLFGSGDEPRPSVMDKDPFGLLLVRHPNETCVTEGGRRSLAEGGSGGDSADMPECTLQAYSLRPCFVPPHQALPLDHALRPVTWPEYRALSCKLACVSAPESPQTPLAEMGGLSEAAVGSLLQLCRERRMLRSKSNQPQGSEDSQQVRDHGDDGEIIMKGMARSTLDPAMLFLCGL